MILPKPSPPTRSRRSPSSWLVVLLLALTVAGPLAADDADFQDLVQRYHERATHELGPEVVTHWQAPAIFLTRSHVARAANATFAASNLRLAARQSSRPVPVEPTEIRTAKVDIVHCNRDRWGCDSDCDLFDLSCHERKVRCEINKAAGIAACEAKKAVQQSISDKKLLGIGFSSIVVSGDAGGRLVVILRPDLSGVDVTGTNLSGTLALEGGSVTFTPELLPGVLFACAKHTVTVPRTSVRASSSDVRALGELLAPEGGSGPQRLAIRFNQPEVELRFDTNPILRILERNLHTLLLCPVAWTLVVPAGAALDLSWDDVLDLHPQLQEIDVELGELEVRIPGFQESLALHMGERALYFVPPNSP